MCYFDPFLKLLLVSLSRIMCLLSLFNVFFMQNPDLVMRDSLFTVGHGSQCNLCLADPSISSVLCKLKHIAVYFCFTCLHL